jgi:hypothetical protein
LVFHDRWKAKGVSGAIRSRWNLHQDAGGWGDVEEVGVGRSGVLIAFEHDCGMDPHAMAGFLDLDRFVGLTEGIRDQLRADFEW